MLATPARTDSQAHCWMCGRCITHTYSAALLEPPTLSACSHFIAAVSPSYPLNFHRWAEEDKKTPNIKTYSKHLLSFSKPSPFLHPHNSLQSTYQQVATTHCSCLPKVWLCVTARFAHQNSLTSSVLGPITVVQLPMSSTGTSLSS